MLAPRSRSRADGAAGIVRSAASSTKRRSDQRADRAAEPDPIADELQAIVAAGDRHPLRAGQDYLGKPAHGWPMASGCGRSVIVERVRRTGVALYAGVRACLSWWVSGMRALASGK